MPKKLTYAQKEQVKVQKGDQPANPDDTETIENFSEEIQKERNSEIEKENSKMDSEANEEDQSQLAILSEDLDILSERFRREINMNLAKRSNAQEILEQFYLFNEFCSTLKNPVPTGGLMGLVGDILHNLKDTASVYHPNLILPTASQLDLPAAPQSDLKRSKGDSCSTEEIMATQVVVSNVHDTPKLTSSDPNDIRLFIEKVKSLHASGMTCRVDHWIVDSKDSLKFNRLQNP